VCTVRERGLREREVVVGASRCNNVMYMRGAPEEDEAMAEGS
jgi:hypothetical protein